MFVKIQMEIPV
jgi:hypothetical protein